MSERDPIDDREGSDEARLQALFDRTAEQPSGPTLTKLAARAVDVPERAQRRPRWLPRWAWSPTLAGLAVGAGVLAVTIGIVLRDPAEGGKRPAPFLPGTVETTAPIARSSPAPLVPSEPPEADDPSNDDSDESFDGFELAGDLGDFEGESADLDFDPLEGPASDSELDVWLEATAELVEGG